MRSSLRRFQSLHSLLQLARFIGRAPVTQAFGGARPQTCVPIHRPQSILKRTSERNGVDQIDINAQAIAQARELFLLFDHLMQSAQSRRLAPLREICIRREFGRRARSAVSRDEAFAKSAGAN
jgi:hypothetical protein